MTYLEIAQAMKENGEQNAYTIVFRWMWQEARNTGRPLGWKEQAPDWIRGEAKV